LLKVRFSGATGKHSAQPFQVDDVHILDLGRPPECDPPEASADGSSTSLAFIAEDVDPAEGLDVDLDACRLVWDEELGWRIVQ
jgi:hypothetical protein